MIRQVLVLGIAALAVCPFQSPMAQDPGSIAVGVGIASGVLSSVNSIINIFGGHDDVSHLSDQLTSLSSSLSDIENKLQNLSDQLKQAQVAINQHVDEDFKHYISTEFNADLGDFLGHYKALTIATSTDDKRTILQIIAAQDVPKLVHDARQSGLYDDYMFATTAILALGADQAAEITTEIAPLRAETLGEFIQYLDRALDPQKSDSIQNRYNYLISERDGISQLLNAVDTTYSNKDVYNWSGNCCGHENESYGDLDQNGCWGYLAQFIFIAGDQNQGYSVRDSDPPRREYKFISCAGGTLAPPPHGSDFVPTFTGEKRVSGPVSIFSPRPCQKRSEVVGRRR
jgi:hypothetical protein